MNSKKKLIITVLALFGLIIITGVVFYIPPLINSRSYNIPGRVYDFVAYLYCSSRLERLKKSGDDREFRRLAAMVVWHRPFLMKEMMGIEPDDLFQLGREYAVLGLEKEAARLFRADLQAALPDEAKSLEIISYLAILGDWPGTDEASAELLEKYPDSVEAEYWRGRALLEMDLPDRAIVHLRRAYRLEPTLSDALYWIGRVEERSGNQDDARDIYEQVTTRVPGHLGAWEDLARIYEANSEVEKLAEARAKCAELTPPISVGNKQRNSLVFLGYRFLQEIVTTGEQLEMELYMEGWRPRSVYLQPEIIMSDPGHPKWFSLKGEEIEVCAPGEVVKKRFLRKIPLVLYPGTIYWGIVFSESVAPAGKEDPIVARDYLLFPPLRLNAGWTSAVDWGRLVKKHFGEDARPLGQRTFLGPGDKLSLNLNSGEKTAGVGLVSYLHYSTHVHQGTTIGWLLVETEEKVDLAYPVLAGQDTAEVYWENAEPRRRNHLLAPVFRSSPVVDGEKRFNAHEYYTILLFPRLLTVKSLELKNCLSYSGWYIADMILFPRGRE